MQLGHVPQLYKSTKIPMQYLYQDSVKYGKCRHGKGRENVLGKARLARMQFSFQHLTVLCSSFYRAYHLP